MERREVHGVVDVDADIQGLFRGVRIEVSSWGEEGQARTSPQQGKWPLVGGAFVSYVRNNDGGPSELESH